MQITIVQGHYPPANPSGITVIIDVIRAFTTANFAFRNRTRVIHPVATAEDAFTLKQQFPHALLVGEINALPIAGFDFGNSPWQISNAILAERDIIMRTTNGIAATLNARHSHQVLVAGLVNAESTARFIQSQSVDQVVLVASHPTGDEDVACAEYMQGLLGGQGISLDDAIYRTRHAYAAQKFLDQSTPHLHAQDIDLAAASHANDGLVMAVKFEPRPNIYCLTKELPPAYT